MFFGNGNETCRAIHFAGRCVDDPFDTQFARGLQHVQRALDVGINVCVRRVVGKWNGDQGRQVQYGITALHCCLDAVGVADIT
ncbi:hypothetical protein D3C72_1398100 [compost metagenome]